MCGRDASAAPDTESLRPDGAGTTTILTTSGCTNNWECVDEATSDGDGTFVYTTNTNWQGDSYTAQDSSGTGTINSVTVYIRSRGNFTFFGRPEAQTVLRTHSTYYTGSTVSLTTSWAPYSTTYATNPNTGSAWTWTEVDDLEIGVMQRGIAFFGLQARTTQVWVEIDYTPPAGGPVTRTRWQESY
jgi:hypothetical protein